MFGWLKDKAISVGSAIGSAVETGLNAVATSAKVGGAYLGAVAKASGTIFKTVAKRVPVLGAVVTSGFVLSEAAGHAFKGDFKLMGASLAVGVPEIAGNIIGFGVGDIAREGARGAFVGIGGSDFDVLDRSDIVTLVGFGAQSFGFGDDAIQSTMTPASSLAFQPSGLKGNFNSFSQIGISSVAAANCPDEILQRMQPESINGDFNDASVLEAAEIVEVSGLAKEFTSAGDIAAVKVAEAVKEAVDVAANAEAAVTHVAKPAAAQGLSKPT